MVRKDERWMKRKPKPKHEERTCPHCGHTWRSRETDCPECDGSFFTEYIPTPDEIRQATAQIRSTWSRREENMRRAHAYRRKHWVLGTCVRSCGQVGSMCYVLNKELT